MDWWREVLASCKPQKNLERHCGRVAFGRGFWSVSDATNRRYMARSGGDMRGLRRADGGYCRKLDKTFGATGSIGQNTLDLLRRDPAAYQVVALSGGRNIAQLAKDALEFSPEVVVTAFEDVLPQLQAALAGSDVAVEAGAQAIARAADRPADWIMSCIVGVAGLEEARRHGAAILPVDSEHSAVFQALIGEDIANVERIIITASGGAFRDWPQADLAKATPAQAQTHPNWSMGQRITIDSASMFNKAMELIETKEFFCFPETKIETIIHPESLIHACAALSYAPTVGCCTIGSHPDWPISLL